MQYQEFLDHIYRKYSGNVKLELDRMQNLMASMGDPQNSLRGFHVAGTNGKGSVCATLEALCLSHGLRTGLNTSPHLIDYTERFRIDGSDLPFQRILDTFHKHETLFEKWEASFFEITTAIAFQIFKEEQLHSCVIEVGLGGRLDATNLFTPDVSAITTIGLDHVKTLGGTLERIAAEKAGIIKPGVPLVLGKIPAAPRKVILDRARSYAVPCYVLGGDFNVRVTARHVTGLEFDYRFGRHIYKGLRTNLIGEHQAANLAVALTAFILYSRERGFKVSPRKVRHALQNIHWRGRMQVLSTDPVIIADGAHNVQGVEALIRTLRKIWPHRKFRFLVSILADKNYKRMLKIICDNAEKLYIAQNESDRAATVVEQTGVVDLCGVPYRAAGSVRQAFEMARSELRKGDILICGGSLYTVGEVLASMEV
jgi:dihydrofolate synthase/folylpolyglutamate synthase